MRKTNGKMLTTQEVLLRAIREIFALFCNFSVHLKLFPHKSLLKIKKLNYEKKITSFSDIAVEEMNITKETWKSKTKKLAIFITHTYSHSYPKPNFIK